MSRQRLAILLCLAVAAFAPSVAFADEPRMEVRSTHTRCEQPFEVTATGLEPSKPVLVAFTFGGQSSPGAVAGNSDATGRFFSPIPKVLLPCVAGGKVTASITVDGKLLAITAQFEVAVPRAPKKPAGQLRPVIIALSISSRVAIPASTIAIASRRAAPLIR